MVRHDVNQETGNPGALTNALRYIRERSVMTSSDSTVHILAAAEPDGVCSAHILTSVLRLEGITYSLQSVDAYTELKTALENLRPSIRTVVLLNCGAVVNLVDFIAHIPDVVVIVIDSHRPIHLKNVTEPARILVLDDDLGRGGYFPAEAMLLESDSNNNSEDIIDNLFLDDDEEDEGGAKRQRTGDNSSVNRKKILREYYEGYYYASPSSLVLYALATDMGYQSQQLLWLAVVGLTSYVESGYFSLDTFRTIAQDVDHHYLSSAPQVAGDENAPINTTTGALGIKFCEDLKLPMYRHWSLLEAMTHSPYVYSELKLYRDHGHGTMQKLLVYAGLSPSNYKQTFSSMSWELASWSLEISSSDAVPTTDLIS
jgi:cell division control protein 45